MKIKFENYGSYRLGIQVGRWQYVIQFWKFLNGLRRARRIIRETYYDLTGQTIYGIWWSRDCDMCESSSPIRFNNKRAMDKYMDRAAEWAEGPQSFAECSKEEFKGATTQTRDRVMEAYENGMGTSIYV
jgi:hypothetical protein